jgi:hypothetical protein
MSRIMQMAILGAIAVANLKTRDEVVVRGPAINKSEEPIPQSVIEARIKRLERNKHKLQKGAWQ